MGRRSRAVQSRLQNLGQLPKSQKARVDDVTDEDSDEDSPNSDASENVPSVVIGRGDLDSEHGFIVFEDYESDSDGDHTPGSSESDSDSEDTDSDFEDENDGDIRNDADLLRFSAILTEAQRVAVKLEQEDDKPKRPKQYTGNAPRTKCFHAQKRRTLAAEGQKFISQFFTGKGKMPPRPPTDQLPSSSDSDSSDEESIIDIDEHLGRIFGGQEDFDLTMANHSKNSEPDSDTKSVSSPAESS